MNTIVEQIKDRLPVAEVLASYITLEPSGNQYKAKCPFHNERTASFYVSPERRAYYCFGCGAKGDIFTFVQQFEGLDFKGALKILAERAQVPLTKQFTAEAKNDGLYEMHEKATTLYEAQLEKEPTVLEYLLKRGITTKTLKEFRIGYVPMTWRFLATALSLPEQIVAEKAGLVKKTEKGYYDRFRGRIMFPLMDSSSRPIGFSGRAFPETSEGPKYLNSPETELFHKSDFLYGFDRAKFAIKKNNFAILVEGQVDLLMSHQAGFRNTVATSGTAVSEESLQNPGSHLRALARLTSNIIVAFDGDEAGQNALGRAVLVLLSLGMNPKVVQLPADKDPADILQSGDGSEWKAILKNSVPFLEYQVKRIQEKKPSPHMLSKELQKSVFPYLARIVSRMELGSLIDQVAQLTGIATAHIADDFARYQTVHQTPEVAPKKNLAEIKMSPYERFVGILQRLDESERISLEQAVNGIVFHEHLFTQPPLTPDRREEIELYTMMTYATHTKEELYAVAEELLKTITRQFCLDLKRKLTDELRERERAHDDENIARLLKELQEVHERLKS